MDFVGIRKTECPFLGSAKLELFVENSKQALENGPKHSNRSGSTEIMRDCVLVACDRNGADLFTRRTGCADKGSANSLYSM